VHYSIEKIINEDDRIALLSLYDTLEPILLHQDYNLFHCERRNVGRKEWEISSIFMNHLEFAKKTTKDPSVRLVTAYFVKYIEGGFARLHHDNGTFRTIVTLVETKDLVGGETVFMDRYKRRPRPKTHLAKRHEREKDNPPYGKEIVPKVARINDGESVIYGPDVKHGVTEVESGHRIVLVTWYSRNGETATPPGVYREKDL